MKEAVRIETLGIGDHFKMPNRSELFKLCDIGTLPGPHTAYSVRSIGGKVQIFLHGDFLVIPESTESFEKNLELLRPLDPAKLKEGEKLLHFRGEREVTYIAGPDEVDAIVVRGSDDRLHLHQARWYRMNPLLWIAGRPVYPGDKLFHEGEVVFIHDHVGNVGWVTCSDGTRRDTKKMTWDRPKVKKEGWVNIYPGRTASSVHLSKEAADMAGCDNRIACVRVDWEE